MKNFFESIRDISENLLEWEPQIPRPDADGPVEDIRQYDKHVGTAVGDFYLTNHPAYMVDELSSNPEEPVIPASSEVQDHIARIASEAATLRAEHGQAQEESVITQEALPATAELLDEEATRTQLVNQYKEQVKQSFNHN